MNLFLFKPTNEYKANIYLYLKKKDLGLSRIPLTILKGIKLL